MFVSTPCLTLFSPAKREDKPTSNSQHYSTVTLMLYPQKFPSWESVMIHIADGYIKCQHRHRNKHERKRELWDTSDIAKTFRSSRPLGLRSTVLRIVSSSIRECFTDISKDSVPWSWGRFTLYPRVPKFHARTNSKDSVSWSWGRFTRYPRVLDWVKRIRIISWTQANGGRHAEAMIRITLNIVLQSAQGIHNGPPPSIHSDPQAPPLRTWHPCTPSVICVPKLHKLQTQVVCPI